MTKQTQRHRSKREATSEHLEDAAPSQHTDTTAENELMDEIDKVLEVNSEEFVRGYVQKGGE